MWLFGLMSGIYLLTAFKYTATKTTLQLNPIVIKQENSNPNDAFVFININKKRLLTKYVASYNTITNSDNKTSKSNNAKPIVEKIIKKPTFKSEKKSTDFTIKAAPNI
jgi:hypothetical protein